MDTTQRKRTELILANQVVIMCALATLLPTKKSAGVNLSRKRLHDAIETTRGEIEPPPFERDF
jgi:hypothetical protein